MIAGITVVVWLNKFNLQGVQFDEHVQNDHVIVHNTKIPTSAVVAIGA